VEDDLRGEVQRVLAGALRPMRETKSYTDWKAEWDAERAQHQAEDRRFHRRMALIFSSIILLFIAGFGSLLWFGIKPQDATYARFLAGCMRDHKEYECMAMWRASDSGPRVWLAMQQARDL